MSQVTPVGALSAALSLGAPPAAANIARVRLLELNDFHGQLPDSDATVDGVKIGGAATLAAYVQRERAANPDGTYFVSSGDIVGASPPESQLLRHELTLAVLAAMGLDLATFGNHEFDNGFGEAMRLIYGDAAAGAHHVAAKRRKPRWPGSSFPWISANLVDVKTKRTILAPYVIKVLNGVKVAFIGATTKDLKNVTVAAGIRNIEALDPADAVNRYVPEIQAQGVHAIVVMVHEGGDPAPQDPNGVTGAIVDLAKRLDPDVDVVLSAHSHKEYVTQIAGKQVIQGGAYAKALGEVDIDIDRATGQVVAASSRLIRNDENGIQPDARVAAMVAQFHRKVAPRTDKVVTTLQAPLTRVQTATGENSLGALIAEAQRSFAHADIGLMNNGGIRQDLAATGPLKWGTLFGVQPFANRVMLLQMTGAQVLQVLEQQFPPAGGAKILQVAGITMHLDMTKPVGSRVKVVMADGTPLDPAKTYKVAANSFIADGGDGFTALAKATKRRDVGVDLDALVAYFAAAKAVPAGVPGRIVLDAGTLPADTQ